MLQLGVADQILAGSKGNVTITPRSTLDTGAAPANVERSLLMAPKNTFACDGELPCIPVSDSNDFFFVTVPTGPVALSDVLVNLVRPCKQFMVSSIAQAHVQDSLYFHLVPIGKGPSVIQSIPRTGTENWIPWTTYSAGASPQGYRGIIRLCKPITKFYLDIGFDGAGAASNLTILCGNDLDMISSPGQLGQV